MEKSGNSEVMKRDKKSMLSELQDKTVLFESLYAEYTDYVELKNIRDELEASEDNVDKIENELFLKLKMLVREIEVLRQEYDKAIFFNVAQEITHDLVFHFDSFKPGQVSSTGFIANMQNIETIIKVKHPNIDALGSFDIVSITTGSGTLCSDLNALPSNQESNEDPSETEAIAFQKANVLADIKNVIDGAKEYATDGITPPPQKLKKFQEKTGVSDDDVLKVYNAVYKVQPKLKDKQPLVSISINGGDNALGKKYIYTPELRESYSKALAEVRELVKKPDQTIITGQIRQMEHWEKAHKIEITESETKKKYILQFTPDDTSKVKDKIGTTVTIERSRIDGKSWIINRWL